MLANLQTALVIRRGTSPSRTAPRQLVTTRMDDPLRSRHPSHILPSRRGRQYRPGLAHSYDLAWQLDRLPRQLEQLGAAVYESDGTEFCTWSDVYRCLASPRRRRSTSVRALFSL